MDTPCVEWAGARTKDGYGQRSVGGRRVSVHRETLALVYGWDALEGKDVMHLCDNPPCYRLGHLRIGTRADNVHDAIDKGRMNMAGLKKGQKWRSLLDTCSQGHPFDKVYRTATTGREQRACSICINEKLKARRAKARELCS
jgi:hypothetical protein